MEISKKLKLLREEHNLTQDDLAFKLKLSRSAISNYENGTRTPDIEVLYDICDLYNITLDSLFSETNTYKTKRKRINYKKFSIIISIFIVVVIIVGLIVYNKMYPKYDYGYDISDDELKVNNSNEVAIIKIVDSMNKTYQVDIIHSFKGDGFEFIEIKNNSIKVNLSNYYLVFGNRVSYDMESRNYISFNYLEIYDNRFIYSLDNYNSLVEYNLQKGKSKTLIDYYSFYLENEEKETILYSSLDNIRKEEYIIDDKNLFENEFDRYNLISDFSHKFAILDISKYKYLDINVTIKINKTTKTNQIVSLFNSIEKDYVNRIVEYKFNYNKCSNKNSNEITIHFRNLFIDQFRTKDDSYELVIRYGYDSIFGSKWTNSELDIKVGFKN